MNLNHDSSRRRPRSAAVRALVLAPVLAASLAGSAGSAVAAGAPTQAACVQLTPSVNVAATVNKAGAGTPFCFAPGLYRVSETIKPKEGMTFTGPGASGDAAVLSGARAVTGWAKSGSAWVAGGQTQAPTLNHGAPGDTMLNPQAQYNQNVYLDGKSLWKVGVKTGGRVIGEPASSVGAGEYFLDYDADQVYLGSDPTGHRVDAAVVTDVFRSEAANVRISGLTVEMAAGIGIRALGGWTLEGNDVRVNAQKGIVANDGTRVVGNSIHHNGAYGITGSGSGVVVENNDVSFNNISRLDTVQGTCNANGGSKFYHTVGAVIRNNNFHDNLCNGIWLDINNYDAIVEGNRVLNNRGHGISFEISYKALIRNNVVEGNDGWGVLVRDSPDVRIEGNTIGANVNGPVMLFNKGRTDHPSSYGPHVTKNVSVSGNRMTVQSGKGVKLGAVDMAGGSTVRNNIRFFDNAYTIGSATARAFKWNGQGLTYLQWKAAGLDTRGTFTVAAASR